MWDVRYTDAATQELNQRAVPRQEKTAILNAAQQRCAEIEAEDEEGNENEANRPENS